MTRILSKLLVVAALAVLTVGITSVCVDQAYAARRPGIMTL